MSKVPPLHLFTAPSRLLLSHKRPCARTHTKARTRSRTDGQAETVEQTDALLNRSLPPGLYVHEKACTICACTICIRLYNVYTRRRAAQAARLLSSFSAQAASLPKQTSSPCPLASPASPPLSFPIALRDPRILPAYPSVALGYTSRPHPPMPPLAAPSRAHAHGRKRTRGEKRARMHTHVYTHTRVHTHTHTHASRRESARMRRRALIDPRRRVASLLLHASNLVGLLHTHTHTHTHTHGPAPKSGGQGVRSRARAPRSDALAHAHARTHNHTNTDTRLAPESRSHAGERLGERGRQVNTYT
jgi:hypothetical protein